MENLIGRKVRGFDFDEGYNNKMDKHIGEVGNIVYVDGNYIQVNFGNETWSYPLDQIKEHLINEVPTKLHERWVIVKASELKELREFKESIKKLL